MKRNDINPLIAQILNCDINLIGDDSSPENLPEWDSLKMIELIVLIEQEFQIQLTQEDLIKFTSVGNIKKILKSYEKLY